MIPNRFAAFLLFAVVPGSAVPQATVETLSGKTLELSRDIASSLAVLVIGFTKASRTQTTEWSRRLESGLSRVSAAQVYEVAVVADVPRLFRGFVIDQIRSSVPTAMHPHFLLVREHAEVWRQLAGATDEDAAYLVAVSHGEVLWRGSGRPTETDYQGLVQALQTHSQASQSR